jgi:UDP-2,3-diacylglucosamine pyrophosphatase LpxH
MRPSETTLVLADAHLRGASDPEQGVMVRFLQTWQPRCHALVLLGDFFEFLAGENQAAIRSYRPVLERLGGFAQLEYVEGNHDFDLSTAIPGLTHARIHAGPVDLHLGGLACRLLHGDRSSPTDLGTRLLRAALQSSLIRRARDSWLPHRPVFEFALAFAWASRRFAWPGRAHEDEATRSRALEELEPGGRQAVLYAHTHKPLLERTDRGLLANPGEARTGGSFLLLSGRTIGLRRYPSADLLAELAG